VLIDLYIQFSIFFELLFGLSYILFNLNSTHKKLLGTLLLQVAYLSFYLLLTSTKLLIDMPTLFMSFIPILLLIGPTSYFMFRSSANLDFKFNKQDIIHLISPVIGFILIIPIFLKDTPTIVSIIKTLYAGTTLNPYTPMTMISGIIMLSYFLFILIQHPRFLPNKPTPKNKVFTSLIGSIILFTFISTLSILKTDVSMIVTQVANFILSTGSILFVLLYFHNPDVFRRWIYEVQKKRYETSQLQGIDPDKIQTKLTDLFDNEHIYLDPDLTLKSLSLKLQLSSHQLSEYINSYEGISFSQFVNYRRVIAAKKLLINQPWRTLLSIGLECGFNSEASFNRNFKKIVKKSPGDYRNSHPTST